MRVFLNNLFWGKDNRLSAAIALSIVMFIALGCACGKTFNLSELAKNTNSRTDNNSLDAETPSTSSDDLPSDSEVESLVKETTSQFADAVESGDFADLHAYASSDFQSSYTVEELRTAFKSYTDKKKLVLPVLRKVGSADAQFDPSPSLRSEKGLSILIAKGKFATKPYNVRYDYEYVWRGGEWKLLKLIIYIP